MGGKYGLYFLSWNLRLNSDYINFVSDNNVKLFDTETTIISNQVEEWDIIMC